MTFSPTRPRADGGAELEALETWSRRVDAHAGTPGHGRRVADLSARLGATLGWSAEHCTRLQHAALLHDLGKLALPGRLLVQTGAVSPRDRAALQSHARLGAQLMEVAPPTIRSLARAVALHHHEAWDGGGYPMRLSGEDIPLEARVVCIADVFDALTGQRAYKRPWPKDRALRIMTANAGTHFDPHLLKVFLTLLLE